jgi:hypothetical protein
MVTVPELSYREICLTDSFSLRAHSGLLFGRHDYTALPIGQSFDGQRVKMGGVCCPCWPSHNYTEIPTSAPEHSGGGGDDHHHHKKKKDCHVAFQNEEIVLPTVSEGERNHSPPCSQHLKSEETLLPSNDSQRGAVDHSLLEEAQEEVKQSDPQDREEKSPTLEQESQESLSLSNVDNPFPKEQPISPDLITLEDTAPTTVTPAPVPSAASTSPTVTPPALTSDIAALITEESSVPATPTPTPQCDLKVDEPNPSSESVNEEAKVDNRLPSVESPKKPPAEKPRSSKREQPASLPPQPRQPSPQKLKSSERMCGVCHVAKPLSEFSSNQLKKQSQAGHVLKCKVCASASALAHAHAR